MTHGAKDGESQMITVANDGGDDGDLPPALTDASGHYELVGLPHAVFDVVAEAQGGKLRGRVAGITPDATTDIALAGVTSIQGTVHGATGLFTVTLDGPTHAIRSFVDASFQIDRIDPGDYTVSVASSDGNGQATVKVAAGQTASVDITLGGNAIVVGKIVDGAGKPVANVPVAVAPDAGDGQARLAITGPPPTSGPDGAFRLEAKPGPSMFVAIVHPKPAMRRGVVLEAGKTTDLGAIVVEPGPAKQP
jgi:hypothetical protein